MWAAAAECEVFLGGSLKRVLALYFLRAPYEGAAATGAVEMMRRDQPRGRCFDALVREVPDTPPVEITPTHGEAK